MSFNTRSTRQSGRATLQTQVTYHQAPSRPLQQQQYQAQQQQQAVYQTNTTPQTMYQQQAQSPAPVYKTQQQQQQSPQQQLQPQQQQVSPQPKVEPGTPLKPENVTEDSPQATDGADNTRPWKKHKTAGFKVNKVQKRRRQNARFRKLLIPKNAIMVLNELKPGIVFDAEDHTNALNQVNYTVRLEIDGQTYTGEGSSKGAAKAAAAENAVKGLILKKIAESGAKKDTEEEEPMESMDDDSSEKGSNGTRRVIPEDEVPWGSLASFALFKLFADWKAQGSSIPSVGTPAAKAGVKPQGVPATPKPVVRGAAKPTMPENPEQLHPVTLVGRLHPGTLFVELSREGNPPNMTFTMGITIDGVQHTGTAKSKKEAKKACAINTLKVMGIPFNAAL